MVVVVVTSGGNAAAGRSAGVEQPQPSRRHLYRGVRKSSSHAGVPFSVRGRHCMGQGSGLRVQVLGGLERYIFREVWAAGCSALLGVARHW